MEMFQNDQKFQSNGCRLEKQTWKRFW